MLRYRSPAGESLGWGPLWLYPCYSRDFVSPILIRPVREQLEHDRIIRLLQARFRRRFDAGINPGAEQAVPVGTGPSAVYPDLVLTAQNRGRKVEIIVEVETVESVNHLEALAEWVTYGRLRPAFHLYVPVAMMEVAKRLCSDHNVAVAEIHSYHFFGDEFRFIPVYRAPNDSRARPLASPARRPAGSKPGAVPAAKRARPTKAGARRPLKSARKGASSRKSKSRSAKRK